MPKYQVYFKTEVQTGGWTDSRDLEHEIRRETVTVTAKNKTVAVISAIEKSRGYYLPAHWGYGRQASWDKSHVTKVTRIEKKK